MDELARELRECNYKSSSGLKYGTELLVYSDEVEKVHSSLSVITKPVTFRMLSGLVRISSSVKKDLVCVAGSREYLRVRRLGYGCGGGLGREGEGR